MNTNQAMQRSEYPATVLEVVDNHMRFKPSALGAVRRFAQANPWHGSLDERKAKFLQLNQALAAAYNIDDPDLRFGTIDGTSSGGSHYIPARHRIVLIGRLSVVTYLHEFAHARGMGERGACRWSINLFRRCFPTQYARLVGRGHMLIRPASISQVNSRLSDREEA